MVGSIFCRNPRVLQHFNEISKQILLKTLFFYSRERVPRAVWLRPCSGEKSKRIVAPCPRGGVFEAFFALTCSESGSPKRRLECLTVCWPNRRSLPVGWIRVKLASLDLDAQRVRRTVAPCLWFGFFGRAKGFKESTPDTHPIRKNTGFSAYPCRFLGGVAGGWASEV